MTNSLNVTQDDVMRHNRVYIARITEEGDAVPNVFEVFLWLEGAIVDDSDGDKTSPFFLRFCKCPLKFRRVQFTDELVTKVI